MSSIGKNIKISIFGESHGKAIGVVIDGLPSGFPLSIEKLRIEMERRAPGRNDMSTPRFEKDAFEILSGFCNGKTTGTPLAAVIYNKSQISKDYSSLENIFRPGHGDYTGYIRYNGFNDIRGGGHFSGRLTAPLVFAGAVARQILESRGITVGSHIKSIKEVEDKSFDYVNLTKEELHKLHEKKFPVIDEKLEDKMKNEILKAKEEQDSVGGIIEAAILNVEKGLGSPMFETVEGNISNMLFSIPAVKGVEFGEGFNITKLTGYVANDEYNIIDSNIVTNTNNNGGILGGITNGMPIIFKVAIKPTPSISKTQKTVNDKNEKVNIEVKGRHDPCIVLRAIPVVENSVCLSILDMLIEWEGRKWLNNMD
ncbi:MAG: chorismate synthase [Clostridiaceae bacterium]